MKIINLDPISHDFKPGKHCPYTEPTVLEDCIFMEGGEIIGFFMRSMPLKMSKLADLANAELRTDRVPKEMLKRSDVMTQSRKLGLTQMALMKTGIATFQYSTIIGSIPPKKHMRRHTPTHSTVHGNESAQTFIKAMWRLAIESENLIKEMAPNIWERQTNLFKEINPLWRFGNIFTSSISNYNISAPYHRDVLNLEGCVNVIITKRLNSKGGNLNIPDYGATVDQCDNSILVYPAWKSLHGVTPIIPTHEGGYRNSLVFYPLRAFTDSNLKNDGGVK